MKVQEAIETIKYASAFNREDSPLTVALDMAIEALEKQEAKKPRIKKALGITIMECPCCEEKESYIGSGVLSKYCPECGQKLDWGD